VKEIGISLANLQVNCGILLDPLEYLEDNINPGLMQVVFEWANKMKFADICRLTEVQEGSIVRTITRLDETCRDFKNAARIIGDIKLGKKLETASELIKRDIVFAASLYVVKR